LSDSECIHPGITRFADCGGVFKMLSNGGNDKFIVVASFDSVDIIGVLVQL
jgi:hypothetical protein